MIRRICSAVAALTVAAGLVAASGAAGEATTVQPGWGPYVGTGITGTTHGPNKVTFRVSGRDLYDIKIGDHSYGKARVGEDNRFSVCTSNYCIRGWFPNPTHVFGEYQPAGSPYWYPFSAFPPATPRDGWYTGGRPSHPGKTIHFRLVHEQGGLTLKDFTIEGRVIGNAHARNSYYGHTFDVSHGGTTFKGYWTHADSVTGHYQLPDTNTWIAFYARL